MPTTPEDMIKQRLPLLSFIHRLYTNTDFQAEFRADPEKAMDDYKLTWEQKVAIYHSGADLMFLTRKPVPGYPILLDGNKVATDPNAPAEKGPNPLSADWWAAYAQFAAANKAAMPGFKAPPSPDVNNRATGDRVSMAGVMILLGEELCQQQNWDPQW
jgi:hypothetical protein